MPTRYLKCLEEPSEEGKRAIGIDAVRAAVGFVQKTAAYGTRKVLLIEPAEAMTAQAANALLKTLEEPPGSSVILLVSSQAGGLDRDRALALSVDRRGSTGP